MMRGSVRPELIDWSKKLNRDCEFLQRAALREPVDGAVGDLDDVVRPDGAAHIGRDDLIPGQRPDIVEADAGEGGREGGRRCRGDGHTLRSAPGNAVEGADGERGRCAAVLEGNRSELIGGYVDIPAADHLSVLQKGTRVGAGGLVRDAILGDGVTRRIAGREEARIPAARHPARPSYS